MPKPINPVYGWVKQPEDERDLVYAAKAPLRSLPPIVDMRPDMPPIYDQGQLGSCTSHGIGRCFQYAEKLAGLPEMMPSRLFLYYNERVQEGTVSTDAGAIIRDGIKACNIYGVVDESLWPYDISKFADEPPMSVYDSAKTDRIKFYASLNQNLDSLKLCLSHGFPFTFGFSVYQNFEDYTDGVLDMPPPGMKYLGGHCVCCVGYDDSKQAFIVANSWGPDWGIGGCLYFSYNYMLSGLCSDFWMMRLK